MDYKTFCEDIEYQIKVLRRGANIIFDHMNKMINDNNKYVFSEACDKNLKLFLELDNKINLLIHKKLFFSSLNEIL